jgi:hypothetical protein
MLPNFFAGNEKNYDNNMPEIMPGFPLRIDSGFTILSSPLLVDFDGDGNLEIVTTTGINGINNRMIFIYRSNGNIYPGWPQQLPFNDPPYSTAAGDIDNDGTIDLAVLASHNIYVFHSDGTLMSGFPAYYHDNSYIVSYELILFDLDNDKKLEIITQNGNSVLVFNSNGQLRTGWPQFLLGNPATKPCVGDINNDGTAEIVTTSMLWRPQPGVYDSSRIYVFQSDGTLFPGWPVEMDSNYSFWGSVNPAILKQSQNGALIITSSNRMVGSDLSCIVSLFTPSAQLFRRWKISDEDFVSGGISLADFNFNEKVKIVTSLYILSKVIISDLNGNILPTLPMIGQISGPDNPTLCKATSLDTLNIITKDNSSTVQSDSSAIYVYRFNGSHIEWSPFPTKGIPKFNPILNDIDGNGITDMIVITTTYINNNYLYVWTLSDVPYNRENFPWPMYGHDRYRTSQYGFVPPDEIVSVSSYEQTPLEFSLEQNYPNPFNPQTKLSFVLGQSSLVTLNVYNILGEKIITLINDESMQAGKHEVKFDASQLQSGIYFYRLSAGKYIETKKMVLLK